MNNGVNIEPVVLQIGTQRHQGWQGVRIRRSIEQIADEFELTLTEQWGHGEPRAVRPGEACQVFVGDELVLTGHVDDVMPDYDAESHTITASGRSLAGDLVDCSLPDRRFDGRSLVQIVRAISAPFGIDVVDEAGEGRAFQVFALEDGQPLAEAIERAAQIRGVRVVSDAQGRLVITHAERRQVGVPLVLGSNIRRGSGQFSDRDRYREYIVEGQTIGGDEWWGEPAVTPRGRAEDPRIRAPRSIVLTCDTPANSQDCRARAELEARRRWAMGRGVTYTVSTWHHDQGLWTPGDTTRVRDAYLGLDETLLVSEVQLIEDLDGRRAELRVAPPAAYEPVPLPEPQAASDNDWGWQ